MPNNFDEFGPDLFTRLKASIPWRGPGPWNADDVVQNSLVKLLSHPRDLRSFAAVAIVTVKRTRTDMHRYERLRYYKQIPSGFEKPGADDDPASEVADREIRSRVRHEMDNLPEDLRQALISKYVLEETNWQIAERLQTTPRRAGLIIERAKDCLRSRLLPLTESTT